MSDQRKENKEYRKEEVKVKDWSGNTQINKKTKINQIKKLKLN